MVHNNRSLIDYDQDKLASNAQYVIDREARQEAKQKKDAQDLSDKQAAAKAWADRPKYPEPKDELKLVCGGQFIIVDLARHNVFFTDGDDSVPTEIFSSAGRYYRNGRYEDDSTASVSVTQAAITFENSSAVYGVSSSLSKGSRYRIDRYNATWHYDHTSNYSYETGGNIDFAHPEASTRADTKTSRNKDSDDQKCVKASSAKPIF